MVGRIFGHWVMIAVLLTFSLYLNWQFSFYRQLSSHVDTRRVEIVSGETWSQYAYSWTPSCSFAAPTQEVLLPQDCLLSQSSRLLQSRTSCVEWEHISKPWSWNMSCLFELKTISRTNLTMNCTSCDHGSIQADAFDERHLLDMPGMHAIRASFCWLQLFWHR